MVTAALLCTCPQLVLVCPSVVASIKFSRERAWWDVLSVSGNWNPILCIGWVEGTKDLCAIPSSSSYSKGGETGCILMACLFQELLDELNAMFMGPELENNSGGELAFKQTSKCKNWLIYQNAEEKLPPWRCLKDIQILSWVTVSRWPCLSRGLDKMTFGGPFQPQHYCSSLKADFGVKSSTQPFKWEFCQLHPGLSFFVLPCSQYDSVTCNTSCSGWWCSTLRSCPHPLA